MVIGVLHPLPSEEVVPWAWTGGEQGDWVLLGARPMQMVKKC